MFRRSGASALTLTLCCLAGCSGKTSVTGTVTYQGATVTTGEVSVLSEDGQQSRSSVIGADGRYVIANPPQGAIKILVKSQAAVPPSSSTSSPLAFNANRGTGPTLHNLVPAKYSDAAKTPLRFTLESGSNEIDLPLVD